MVEIRRRTIVTNQSGVTADFVRKRLDNGESFEIIDRDINVWRDDPTISGAISSGDLIVSNGLEIFTDALEGEYWFYGLPHAPIGSLQVGATQVFPNTTTGAITFSGVGLVTVDSLFADTIKISSPDAASLFQLIGVSGTLANAITTLSGTVGESLDFLLNEIIPLVESPATTVQQGFTEQDNTLSTTTSTDFIQKIRLEANTSLVVTGTSPEPFRIQWYWEWGFSGANAEFNGRLQLDDFDTIAEIQWRPTATSDADWQNASGYEDMLLSSGTHTFDLDFRSTAGNKTARIRRSRLALIPLTLSILSGDPPLRGNP